MTAPKVTVLMPVYNGDKYLREAIDSILNQTLRDFELLVINDGSTDDSCKTIESYGDNRIRLVSNPGNLGLIATLNRGIGLAEGKYIARMDCDDICQPDRLARQMDYLDAHPACGVVAAKVIMVSASGQDQGAWNDDVRFTSSSEIRQRLPRANCIAHPTVMARKDLFSRYGYDPAQVGCEDYDLWLRMASDDVRIDKLDLQLLHYRVTPGSVTAQSKTNHPDLKNLLTKVRFCNRSLKEGRINLFMLTVFANAFMDLYYFLGKLFLTFFITSTARAGRLMGGLLPGHNKSGLFFFFPFCHIGGAEKVHSDIVNCFADKQPWVFFTKWSSRSPLLRSAFNQAARTFNWTLRLKYTYPLSAGIMAGFINRHPDAVVFGCNTLFFYKILPWLAPHVRKVDLLHAFGGGAEKFSLPTVNLLNARVVINRQTINDYETQYTNNGIDQKLLERIQVIENCVDIPPSIPKKTVARELKIIYVGRDSVEKRVHLIGKIAALVKERGIPASFTLVGDIQPSSAEGGCRLTGEILDHNEMNRLYGEADLLLLTSSREGFPLVIMEAMAHGVVPVSTAVGGISRHIQHGKNGWLVDNLDNEQFIVENFCSILAWVAADRQLLEKISRTAYEYAAANFSPALFCRSYRQLLLIDGEDENA